MKIFLILFAFVVVCLGTGGGLAYFGIVMIPGITPVPTFKVLDGSKNQSGGLVWNLVTPVDSLAKRADADEKAAQGSIKKTPEAPVSTAQPDLGDTKLASLWNDLDVTQLVSITKKWQTLPLARVLAKMESDQVTKYLDTLDPARADEICRAIQSLAAHPSGEVKS
jgi:hypothetical protein